MYFTPYSAAMPVLGRCATLLVIPTYLGLGPDQPYACVSISVEQRTPTISDPPYTPESFISQEPLRAAAVCRFYLETRARRSFHGPLRFAIDQVIYQEEIKKGIGPLVYQQKIADVVLRDGYVSYICMWNSRSRTNLCGF